MEPRPAARSLDNLTPFVVSGGAGDYVYRRGDRGRHLYVIRVGEIELTWPGGGAAERSERLTTGEFFGELALYADAPRDCSARAVTDYQLLRIDRETFDQIVAEDPHIAVGMLRKLSARSRRQLPVSAARFVELGSRLEFPIRPDAVSTIGRRGRSAQQPDIDLTAVDIERSLSRTHATVQERDGECVLQPRNTVNGTVVNGVPAPAGADLTLAHGDLVRFGRLELRFLSR